MPGAIVQRDERVTLRTVEQEDVSFLQRAGATPEIRYPLGNPVMNREQYDIADETGTDRLLVCIDDDAGPGAPEEGDLHDLRRIGAVTVADADYKRPELGYWLVPAVHGDGYGTEAVSLVVEYVFRAYDAPAIGAEAFDFNNASRGLLESLGFAEEGRRRKFMFVDGEHSDMVQYGLLRGEWREQHE
jgi:RimJ/RimL family protein N-acetyltransferase